jgi:hypothetical protein
MSMVVSIIPLMFIMVLFFIIPVMIGVFVYRDASERGMNALLWTIVAVFVPSLIGLIIYLIFRENYSSLSCASCGERVRPEFVNCPSCGAGLKDKCPSCLSVLEMLPGESAFPILEATNFTMLAKARLSFIWWNVFFNHTTIVLF